MTHDESSGVGERPNAQQVEGRYANHISVGHNAFEFVLDFGQSYPDSGRARVHTRIITRPSNVKAFIETLRESAERYEGTFGPIDGIGLGSRPGGGKSDDPDLLP